MRLTGAVVLGVVATATVGLLVWGERLPGGGPGEPTREGSEPAESTRQATGRPPTPETTDAASSNVARPSTSAGRDLASCELGPPVAVPDFAGRVAPSSEADGLATVGGHPEGVWVFDSAVFMLDSPHAARFVWERSSLSGKAWAVLGDGRFQLSYQARLVLMTEGKPVESRSRLGYAGRYSVEGSELRLEPRCRTGDTSLERVSFSSDGDALTLVLVDEMESGVGTLVLEGRRVDDAE